MSGTTWSAALGVGSLALLLAACSGDPTGADGRVQGRAVYGVDESNHLREFGSENPGTPSREMTITGVAAGETIVGMDFNAADGRLYGVGSSANIYVIDTVSAAATLVGSGGFLASLSGTSFGVDFNPVPNRLRLQSDAGINLRLNQLTGALAATDAALVYADGDVNADATAHIVGTAYTNSVAGATTTVLYAIDSNLDVLVMLPSPNSGKCTTVGSLGLNTDDQVGFDIAGDDGTAYATLTPSGGASALYTIDVATGRATLKGTISGSALVGIAVAP